MTGVVLDASAVLALTRREDGADLVADHLAGSSLSTANLAEVLGKHVDHGADPTPIAGMLEALGVRIEPVTDVDADLSAAVRARSGERRLSLGDRLCLALGMRLEAVVLTADRAWADLDLPVSVELIR